MESLENGTQLGWLINRKQQQVEFDRPNQPVEILAALKTLSGEAFLPGFGLDLTTIW